MNYNIHFPRLNLSEKNTAGIIPKPPVRNPWTWAVWVSFLRGGMVVVNSQEAERKKHVCGLGPWVMPEAKENPLPWKPGLVSFLSGDPARGRTWISSAMVGRAGFEPATKGL
tara:strand:+ start:317 stop:652 length:336 start_codon:yes stop_codon:yes gene_type:complete